MNAHDLAGHGRRLQKRLALVSAVALSAVAAESCFLIDEHILTVRNETAGEVDGLVVRIKTQEVSVPPLAPGASTTVRMRINAESHWEIFAVNGDKRRLLGVCGYTGTTPGRPSENTLRVVPASERAARECVVSLG